MGDFLLTACPWIAMGVAVAIAVAYMGKSKKNPEQEK